MASVRCSFVKGSLGENKPQSLKRFLSNFNVVAIFLPQNHAICIQRHLLSTSFCYSDGFARLCCHCQHDTSLSILTTLFDIKSLWPKLYSGGLTVYHQERKHVSNVLKANGYTKAFLRNCQKPVKTSSTPNEREPATGFAVIPYIQGVTEPIKRILNSHNVKVAQKPFQTLGHIFAKPKDPVKKEQRTEPISLVAAFRSPLLKALDRSVETLGL